MIKITLNYTFIDEHFFNCFDSVIATVVLRQRYRFELMFINSWGFSFNSLATGLLSHRLNPWIGNIHQPLSLYHGIKMENILLDTSDAFSYIEQELKDDHPIILNTNIYWCPWNSRFQRINDPHSTIIVGVNPDNRTLDCLDKTTWLKKKGPDILPYNCFFNGYRSLTVFTFEKTTPKINWRQLIRESVLCMKSRANYDYIYQLKRDNNLNAKIALAHQFDQMKKNTRHCFDEIRDFSRSLSGISNFENEQGINLPADKQPLNLHLRDMACGRKKYGLALKYFGEKYHLHQLLLLSQEISDIGWLWEEIKFLIFQAFETGEVEENLQKSSQKILEIADREELFAHKLLKAAGGSINWL